MKKASVFNATVIFAVILSAVFAAYPTGGAQAAAPAGNDAPKKVYVCKYVGKPGEDERLQTGQNPIEVSVNAIPIDPVVVGSYFADAQGRSYVLGFSPMSPEPDASDCPVPENHTWSATFEAGASCTDAWLSVKIFEDGKQVATDTVDFGNVWSDPYSLETYSASGSYSYGDQSFKYDQTINEPSNCLKQHEWRASFDADSNCDVAWVNVTIYEDGVVVKTDKVDLGNVWTNPYEIEQYPASGTYSYAGQTFGYNLTIKEKEACLKQREYSATFTPRADCSNGYVDVVVYQDGEKVATDTITFGGIWMNPYETEHQTVSGNYTWEGHSFSYGETVQEPSDCTTPVSHQHQLKRDGTCIGYVVTPVSEQGTFVPDADSAPLTGTWKDPKNPNESAVIKGVWKFPDGFEVKDSVTVKETLACNPKPNHNWKPVCPTCDLVVHGLERIVSWPTQRGDANWKSRNLEGASPAGVAVYVSIDDCSTSKAARCLLTQTIHVEYNADVFKGHTVQFMDNGSERPMNVHMGADGVNWATYDGRVCTWQDKDRRVCDSSNDWYVLIDGVRQLPYVYNAPNNLLYPYWVCSLPPTMAMTRQGTDGKWEIEWLPGMNTWGASIFYLKYTNVWPVGWPEDTTQHSWIWKLPPLSNARNWANNYRAAGQYNYYPLP